ncbi:hypothetical protein HU200_007401 [Digitaria exilis]|uniref:Uncharacterized protein n=1 Tax=Digitaria exilis TaxID=1010633 RepID=A0A835FNX9_9POAL|nr:hypothetical protein HU200_007401 [Digitaria exilis]
MDMLDWWLWLRKDHNKQKQRGIDSAFMLTVWCLWKERNGRTFSTRPTNNVNQMIDIIINSSGQLWVQAGAKWMAAAGGRTPRCRL